MTVKNVLAMIHCIMTEQKIGVDHVLDESDATLRAELGRLEAEKKRMTARLDDRIVQIRSILKPPETLPLFTVAPPVAKAIAQDSEVGSQASAVPRGKRQKTIYEFLSKNPAAGYRELVEAAYGDFTDSTYNSARNAVRAMKQDGWITGEPGEWKVSKGGAT